MNLAGFKTLLLDIEQREVRSAVCNSQELVSGINQLVLDKTFFNTISGTLEDNYYLRKMIEDVYEEYESVFGNNVKKVVVNVPTLGTKEDVKLLRGLLTQYYRKPYFLHTSEAITYGGGLDSALIFETGDFCSFSVVINKQLMNQFNEYYVGVEGLTKKSDRLGISFKETMIGDLFEDTSGFPYIVKNALKEVGMTERGTLLNNILLAGPLVHQEGFELFPQYLEEVLGKAVKPPSIVDSDVVLSGLFAYSKKF